MLSYVRTRRGRWASRLVGIGLAWGLGSLLGGCVDKYTPPVLSAPQNYLVVNGLINLNGVTTVQLSRSRNLSAGTASPAEAGASAAIQDEAGASYPLTEQAAGTYTSAALTLGPSHRYQLRLRTAVGREYASDLVAAKLTPPIDSVSWAAEPRGVQIYVDTHDPANATRYYRWSYQETWEFHSAFLSTFEYVNGQFQPRKEGIDRCWRTENSSRISLSTSGQLTQDVISQFPLTLLPPTSSKFYAVCSILVQQYALTAEEFAYWDKLRKNTENLGTLFDPLPSQLSGNVHRLDDASELVLGYVGASSTTEKRILIKAAQFPPGYSRPVSEYRDCGTPDVIPIADAPITFRGPGYLPIEPVPGGGAYAGASARCVDCRLRGTNVKPSYFP